MQEGRRSISLESLPTRRHMLGGIAASLGACPIALAQAASTQEPPSSAANQGRTFLHQEVAFHASPQRLFDMLLDSKFFAAFTGMPAEIDRKPGGAFKTFGGLIEGRNIEIVANQRIVQAWVRPIGNRASTRSSGSSSSR
jgi:activator of HSP90 ATPase